MRTGQEMARKESRRCLSLAGVDQATAFRLRACHSHGDHRESRALERDGLRWDLGSASSKLTA